MDQFTQIFLTTMLPVAVAVGFGWLLGRWRQVPPEPLARATIDIFAPALMLGNIPSGMSRYLDLLGVLLLSVGGLMLLAYGVARLMQIHGRDERTGFVFAVSFCNFGFFGLPVVEFALGPAAFGPAMMILAFLNIPTGLVGAFLAAPQPDVRQALRTTFALPFTWAVVGSLLLGFTDVALPDIVIRPLQLVGDAAVPLMLVLLGLRLAQIQPGHVRVDRVAAAVLMRLLLSPIIIATAIHVFAEAPQAIPYRSAVLQLSTPSGLTPLLFMVAFHRDTRLLAAAILWSTVLSMFSVPLVIAWLA